MASVPRCPPSIERRSFLGTALTGAVAATLGVRAATGLPASAASPTSAGGRTPAGVRAAPNILFLLGEQHRWDWLGGRGEIPVRTPHLDRLAARGIMFDECRCNSPLCAPSRAGLVTGRRYHRAGVPDNRTDLDLRYPTVMQLLRELGYRVALVGKSDLHKHSLLFGLDGWSPRLGTLGFTEALETCGKRDGAFVAGYEHPIEPYMDYLHRHGVARAVYEDLIRRTGDMRPVETGQGIATEPFPVARRHQLDDFCGRRAIEMIGRFPRHSPWFMQISWASAHPPFDAAAELVQRYAGVRFPPPVDSDDAITDHQAVRRQYAAMIEGMDEWIGRVLDAVAARGELDRTLVVYSADHGELLGDHGRWNKGPPLEPSVHVPLIVAGPGVARVGRSQALVELNDLAATFLDWAGRDVPSEWDARSLRPVLSGVSPRHRDLTISELTTWRSAFDGRYKLVEQPKGTASGLFDLVADPHERQNLVSARPSIVGELQARLHAELLHAAA